MDRYIHGLNTANALDNKSKEDLYKPSKEVIQKAADESACIMRIEKVLYNIENQRRFEGKLEISMESVAEEIFEDVKKTLNK